MQLEPRIRAWIEDVALPGRRVGSVRRLTGGHSNDNVLITMTDSREFVVRRYLRRNTCAVESALSTRLAGVVPVAEVVAADATGEYAGEPVLLSSFVAGRQVSEVLAAVSGQEVAEVARSVGATLAGIASVRFPAPGFFSGGRLVPGPPGTEPTSGLDVFVQRCLKEGNAADYLGEAEQERLLLFAERAVPDLKALHGSRHLVHADYNPKNLLAARIKGAWQVVAVLDWEFAYSSSPLFDVGNLLRDPRPPGFEAAFIEGFTTAGGGLPAHWRRLSRMLDLYSLADLLTRPASHPYFRRAVERIRALPTVR